MRRLWIVVALLAFGYTLLPAIPASAGYGAIAWDRGTGKYGASWNQPTATARRGGGGARRMRRKRLQGRGEGRSPHVRRSGHHRRW